MPNVCFDLHVNMEINWTIKMKVEYMILDNSVHNNCYFNPFKDKQTALLYYIFFFHFF